MHAMPSPTWKSVLAPVLQALLLCVACVGLAWAGDGARQDSITGSTGLEPLSTPPEKPFCFDCYEENFARFNQLLRQFKAMQTKKPARLETIDDFRVSRVGVLIHEQCFDGRFDFDVEQAVTDAVIKGMELQIKLTHEAEKYLESKGQSYYSHIPRLVNLLTNSSRIEDGLVLIDTSEHPLLMRNPCHNYKTLPIAKDMDVKRDCKYVSEVDLGRPKVICQADQFTISADKFHNTNRLAIGSPIAYGTGPQDRHPSFVNYQGKTKVYNYPVVAFTRDRLSEVSFKSTLWHEMMHNSGYSHEDVKDKGTPDYAYMCQIATFGDEYVNAARSEIDRESIIRNFDGETIGTASQYCVEPKKGSSHDSILGDYLRFMQSMDEPVNPPPRIKSDKRKLRARYKAVKNDVILDTHTHLEWTSHDNGSAIGWDDANRHCTELPTAGGSWRLPSMDELQAIYDYSETLTTPCGQWICEVSPLFELSGASFWSGETKYEGTSKYAFNFYLDNGYRSKFPRPVSEYGEYEGYLYRALCVRPHT